MVRKNIPSLSKNKPTDDNVHLLEENLELPQSQQKFLKKIVEFSEIYINYCNAFE